ncbi:hypothetical protein KC316_g4443, partial [Hortaea werneckii]
MADEEKKPDPAPTEEAKPEEDKPATEKAKETATDVKDNVFSMFGGGAKKESKPEENDEENDRSGSAKAQAEKAKAEGGEGGDE